RVEEKNLGEILGKVLPEDLLKYGLIPEFVGRLPVMTHVHNLDKQALVDILTMPKNALVKQYEKFFEFDKVELVFQGEALESIADQAMLRGTGARGLRAIMEEVLLGVMYDLPSRKDVRKCVIDRDVVMDGVNPTLVPKSEAASRPAPRPRRERTA
ncbi:MAG: ATP-dependent Clp protease ATP-binding subunit ClpX, partial [Actinomycetota bacterium]